MSGNSYRPPHERISDVSTLRSDVPRTGCLPSRSPRRTGPALPQGRRGAGDHRPGRGGAGLRARVALAAGTGRHRVGGPPRQEQRPAGSGHLRHRRGGPRDPHRGGRTGRCAGRPQFRGVRRALGGGSGLRRRRRPHGVHPHGRLPPGRADRRRAAGAGHGRVARGAPGGHPRRPRPPPGDRRRAGADGPVRAGGLLARGGATVRGPGIPGHPAAGPVRVPQSAAARRRGRLPRLDGRRPTCD